MSETHPSSMIDSCHFFPNPQEPGGHIYLSGWAFEKGLTDKSNGQAATIEVELYGKGTVTLGLDIERADVMGQFKSAPLKCGFSGYIPVSDNSALDHPVVLYYRSQNGRKEIARQAVSNIKELLSSPKEGGRLNSLSLQKLDNLIRNEEERIHKVELLKSKPLYLIVDPNFSCQLNCPCCHSNMARKSGLRLPPMKDDIFDSILSMYGETLIMMYLANWGEPFINLRTINFAKKAHHYNIWTTASTNMNIRFSDDDISKLIESGHDHLIMSIDGATQEVYEKYRKGGDIGIVLENIRRIIKRKKELGSSTPALRWQYLIFPWNLNEVESARAVAKDLGVDEFEAKEGDLHEWSRFEFKEEDGMAERAMESSWHNRLTELARQSRERFKYFGCDHLYHQLSINSDGSIHPCCYTIKPSHAVGKISRDDETNHFNAEKLLRSRGMYRYLDCGSEVKGYDPCLSCPVIVFYKPEGHVLSALNFPRAFEMITKGPVPNQTRKEEKGITITDDGPVNFPEYLLRNISWTQKLKRGTKTILSKIKQGFGHPSRNLREIQ